MSHLNSYTRGVLDDWTPYDMFVERHGEEGRAFLEKIGITRIPPNEVTLDPALLGERFRRHAEKVVLRRYGVIPPAKKTGGA